MSAEHSGDEGEPHEPEMVIVPVAPKVVLQEESQVEVSASPAFQCLDELFKEGKLTGTKVALLKAKYTDLYKTLAKTRDSEATLLKEAKANTVGLDRQRTELEKADNFPESSNTEVTKLRTQFLKHRNEFDETEERNFQYDFKIESLQEEQRMLVREYSRMPKKEEIDKQTKELEKNIGDLRVEISQRQLEAKNLKEELENRNRQIDLELKDLEKEVEKMEVCKGNLVQVQTLPGQYIKEMDKIGKQRNEVDKQLAEQKEEYNDLKTALTDVEIKCTYLEDDKFDTDNEREKLRTKVDLQQREFDIVMKEYEYAKKKKVPTATLR